MYRRRVQRITTRLLSSPSFRWILSAALLALTSTAQAQFRRDTSSVAIPPTGYAAPDDALAMAYNPAALAYLSGWGVQYVHADADDRERFAERGDGFYAAMPLLYGLSAGLSVDSVRPAPVRLGTPPLSFERTMVSLGVAYRVLESIGIGATARVLFGSQELSGLFTLDLAATWRPLPQVAVSFIARDLTGPGYQAGAGRVPRSFLLSLGLRPDGTRALSFDIAAVVDDEGHFGARAAGELEMPWVGRLLAAAEFSRLGDVTPDFRVTAGLAVDFGQGGVGGGILAGDSFASPGWYVTGRIEEDQRRGIPMGEVVLEIELEGVGARSMLAVQRRLERALTDRDVRGVVLRMQGAGVGLAYAQELRQLIDRLEAADKHVICSLADASGSELYACAGAERIVVDPSGGVRLYGPSSEIQHYGQLFRNAGVRADFVRIGRFKAAIEEYQDDAMSEGAREERNALLDELSLRMRDDLARDRGIEFESVQGLIDRGPYLAQGAVDAGLVDSLAGADELGSVIEGVFGSSLPRQAWRPTEVDRRFADAPHVGVVMIDGEMTDGENSDIPLLEIHTTGGRTASAAIDAFAADPNISVIILRIDTPGGSVLASDQIYRAVLRARRVKPVIASMGAVAASGGYYVAAACEEIWAEPSTITGSIGVWFGKVDFEPLATRLGAHTEQLTRGAHGGAESLFRPFTADERSVLADAVRHWYRTFLERVASGRNMPMTEVHALAQGRVYTGDHALSIGLVDHLGGFTSVLERARELGHLPDDAGYQLSPTRPASLLDYVLSGSGLAHAAESNGLDAAAEAELRAPASSDPSQAAMQELGQTFGALSPELRRVMRAVYVMRAMGSAEPMALMPYMVE